ncbi:hypothetical protein CR513_01029, partial [Mucuna pruriens]
MGFRLLRLHGHQVSPNVFENFKKNGEFFCFSGQSNQAVTGMFNLFRASQVLFQGEKILEDAKNFSAKFLTEKRAANELLDKWIITKDLPGEVGYALDVPWYASLPRLETRFYLEQYGGSSDVWIGKTLYRMPYVNNDVYLELAKLDYSNCQAVHCAEWENIQSIFEPERSPERLAWAKTAALLDTLRSYIKDQQTRTAFVDLFDNSLGHNYSNKQLNKREEELLEILLTNVNYLGFEMFRSHGQEFSHYLNQTWQGWLSSWQNEGNSFEREAEVIVQIINLMSGYWSEELLLNPEYERLLQVTNRVCHGLRNYQSTKDNLCTTSTTTPQIESDMQQLVQLALQNSSDGVHPNIKNSFLTVAKGFYYAAYCGPETINSHIDKVLFQKGMFFKVVYLPLHIRASPHKPNKYISYTPRIKAGNVRLHNTLPPHMLGRTNNGQDIGEKYKDLTNVTNRFFLKDKTFFMFSSFSNSTSLRNLAFPISKKDLDVKS